MSANGNHPEGDRDVLAEAEAIRIAPDETLIVILPEALQESAGPLSEMLTSVGLEGRAMVLASDDLRFYVLKRNETIDLPLTNPPTI